MKTRNNVQLIGYLGLDPEIKSCKNGNQVTLLRLATHRAIESPDSSPAPKWKSTWHTIMVWGVAFAREISDTCLKGSHLMIEGSIRYSSFKDAKGITRFSTMIDASRIINLDR